MSQFYKDGNPTLCLVYFDIILPSISIISMIPMLPAFCKYIKLKNIKKKCLFWAGLLFYITIFLSIISGIAFSMYFCRDLATYNIVLNVFTQSYVVQTLLLLGILFARLYYVFKESRFPLSKITIKLYVIFYSLMIIFFIVGTAFRTAFRESTVALAIYALAFLMQVIVIVILVSLFLYKITEVYKDMNKDDKGNINPKLIIVVTKTSVLASISISITLVTAIAAIITPSTRSVHVVFGTRILSIFDLATNFWCIILSYRGYNGWYLKICAYCDSKCAVCWNNIVRAKSKESVKCIEETNQTNVVKI